MSDRDDTQCYLPDLCTQRNGLVVVLMAELVAIVFTLARYGSGGGFWFELASTSFFLLWTALLGAAILCLARRYLQNSSRAAVTLTALVIILFTTLVVSEAAWLLGQYVNAQTFGASLFADDHGRLLTRNLGIAAIVATVMLRYFYVSHQWQRNVEMEARSRVHALQARIRPHFLFNSMNTIAALTRSDPAMAEEAVEDLSDLFRVSLRDARHNIPLKEELEIARVYQRIEQLRLGERLNVQWDVADLPMRAHVPSLLVQPLLENAIYHGIEPIPEGGTVIVAGKQVDNKIEISITNPLQPDAAGSHRPGNQLALENIRQRLELAYPDDASVDVVQTEDQYRITLRFPLEGNAG